MADNNWSEWSRHVLKELERLNEVSDQQSKEVTELKGRLTSYSAEEITTIKVELKAQMEKDKDQETRIRALETSGAKFSGKWAILSIIGAAIVSGLIALAFKIFTPSTADAATLHDATPPGIEYRVDGDYTSP